MKLQRGKLNLVCSYKILELLKTLKKNYFTTRQELITLLGNNFNTQFIEISTPKYDINKINVLNTNKLESYDMNII